MPARKHWWRERHISRASVYLTSDSMIDASRIEEAKALLAAGEVMEFETHTDWRQPIKRGLLSVSLIVECRRGGHIRTVKPGTLNRSGG